MNEEEARQQKLEALKKRYDERQKETELEQQLNQVVRTLLTEEAKARLNNVKLVNKELYMKTVQAIVYLKNAGKISGKLSEEQLKALLETLRNKREISIKRK